MTRHVWIDLTDLGRWTGHMTGIQRVVFNVAARYHEHGTARFFAFTRGVGFREVDFADVAAGMALGGPTHTQPSAARSFMHLAMGFPARSAGALYRRTTPGFKDFFRRTRSELLERRMELQLRRRGVQEQQAMPHPFGSGDVLLLLGASWSENHIPALNVIKRGLDVTVVHAIMDLIPIRLPQFFVDGIGREFLHHMFEVFAVSDHLLAISENTKKDSEQFQRDMSLPQVPISVFRLGDDSTATVADSSPDPRVVPGAYVLAVGTLEVRKNYIALYNAWVIAAEAGTPMPTLVIVGQPGWLADDFIYQAQADPRVEGKIVLLTSVGDEHLAWLYANCLFTAYPSWYEGWGLPVAESLHYGKLCVASSTSSVPEIAGDLIEYREPHDARGFYEVISRYANDPDALAAAEARIAAEYAPTTWERSYADTRAAIAAITAGDAA
jgi:glycosyltransferase involved in cell wall biosynthesis